MSIIMYATPSSPFSARVRLVAAFTDARLDERPIPGTIGSDERKAISHFGKVPAIDVGGRVLIESVPLMEYLVDLAGGSPLLPGDAIDRARVRGIITGHDNWALGAVWPMFLTFRSGKPDPAIVASALAAAAAEYDILAELFDGDHGLALFGTPTLADLAIAPFGTLFGRLCPMFGHVSPFEANTRLASWWKTIRQVEPVARVLNDMDEAFTRMFIKK